MFGPHRCCPNDLKYCPCPPARDFGSRVSGLVSLSIGEIVFLKFNVGRKVTRKGRKEERKEGRRKEGVCTFVVVCVIR